MKILYKNLKGLFTGEGFAKKSGRHVTAEDCGFVAGPVHVLVDQNSKQITEVSSQKLSAEKEIDCEGLVATAGLVDSHTHALFGGSRWPEFFQRWAGADYAAINAAGGGIRKTFRDTRAASDVELEAKLLQDIQAMAQSGVRVLEIKSGYGETLAEELRILRLINKAKKETDMEIASTFLGLHAIPQSTNEESWTQEATAFLEKVAQEQLAEFADSFPEKGFFSLESARTFSTAAIKLGLKVKIHADEMTAFGASELGAELGATSVDHLQKISDQALALLAKSDTIATLLPATSFYLGIEYAPARKIINAGARVALASDYNPGTAPNASLLFTTMLASAQLKMSPAEIFCGVTFNAAAAVNRATKYGLVKSGYSSQLIFWNLHTNEYLEELLLSGNKPVAR